MDTKINHEDIGKNRCHDPNTRLGKLMWNYFTKHVRHMEQVTKQGHYRFFKILASGPRVYDKREKNEGKRDIFLSSAAAEGSLR